MKKEMSNIAMSLFVLALCLLWMPYAFSDDDMPSGNEGGNTGMDRGLEHANQPKKDALTAWHDYFFGKPVDPLDAQSMENYQQGKEERDKRVQAGAEFTQAASTLVGALPTNAAAETAAQMVVSETTGAVVDSATSPPPAQPNAFQRFINWVASWFK